jgi:hypothetical protein
MKRRLTSVLIMALALGACSWLFADDPKPAPKGARGLPPNWSKLGLSEKQKNQALAIVGEYRNKIDLLQQQIKELQKKERADLNKILTDDQRARLKEILAAKAGIDDEDKAKGNNAKDKK